VFRPGSSKRSDRIWKMFAPSATSVVAEARLVRVTRASSQARECSAQNRSATTRISRTHPAIASHSGVAVADGELHQLLTDRGWVEIDRVDELTMYDWPPSAPDEEHESTYLIIDLRGQPGAGSPYRVSLVNGDRLMYEVESALVADLNRIEASRCAGCTPCAHEAAR
jgi:hypothetical protein